MSPAEWLPLALQTLAPSGAVMYAVKVALNGSKQRIEDVHTIVIEMKGDIKELHDETKVLRDFYHGVMARVFVLERTDDGRRVRHDDV